MSTSTKNKIHRREFVRQGATATLAATNLFGSGLSNAFAFKGEYTLKSEAQFRNEAAQYASAIREIRKVPQMKLEDGEVSKASALIEQAAPALKYQLSAFIVMCLSDSALVNAVRKKIPNQAALDSFAAAGVKNLSVFLELDGVKALQARMLQTSLDHREAVLRAAEHLRKAGNAEESDKAAAKRAQEDQECTRIFVMVAAIIAAVVAILVAVVVAVFTFGAGGPVQWVQLNMVAPLYLKYGPNLSDVVIEKGQGVADARYARCVAAARRLPPVERAKAVATCQAQWLDEKAFWLIAA